jgi:selenocysteine-specific elongation factor
VRYNERPVRHNLLVTFHSGSAEVEGRLLLLDHDRVAPGDEAWTQVRLSEPIAAIKGDRFVIRDPNDTLGGGVIVDTEVKRHRRNHAPTIASLESLARGSPEELVMLALRRLEPVEAQVVLKQSGVAAEAAHEALDTLIGSGDAVPLPGAGLTGVPLIYTSDGLLRMTSRLKETLGAFHKTSPLRPGMAKEELRSRLGLSPRVFDQLLVYWKGVVIAKEIGAMVALAEHEPRLQPEQEAKARIFLEALQASPYSPPDASLDEDLLAYLEANGEIVRVSDGVAFLPRAYEEMVERVSQRIRNNGSITLAQVRDMFGTSRKYAQALLEHMDEERITRRVGDERVLRKP